MSLITGDFFFVESYENYVHGVEFCLRNGCKNKTHPITEDEYNQRYENKTAVICIRHNKVISLNAFNTYSYDTNNNNKDNRQFKKLIFPSVLDENHSALYRKSLKDIGTAYMNTSKNLDSIVNSEDPYQPIVFVYGKALDTMSNAEILRAIEKTKKNKEELQELNIQSTNITKQIANRSKAITALTLAYDKREVV